MNKGVPAAPSGHSAEPAPISVVAAQGASVPNAALELHDLARRCIQEAGNWSGTPMQRGLLDIARQAREKASAIEARSAKTAGLGPEGESATRDSGGRPNDAQKGSANV